jgi:hypothetical protein
MKRPAWLAILIGFAAVLASVVLAATASAMLDAVESVSYGPASTFAELALDVTFVIAWWITVCAGAIAWAETLKAIYQAVRPRPVEIVTTSSAHGLSTGDRVTRLSTDDGQAEHFRITRINATQFSIHKETKK